MIEDSKLQERYAREEQKMGNENDEPNSGEVDLADRFTAEDELRDHRADSQTIEEMQAEVVRANARHDWGNGSVVAFPVAISNLHGEVSEAWEAWRKWGYEKDATREGVDYLGNPHKPEGVGSEFADVFIRLLDNCATYGIDLRAEYERKIAYNLTRPAKHGGKRA